MIKETFSFLSGNKKTQIHAVKWFPEDKKYDTILQITHGMVEFIERYEAFASFLTEHRILVVGHDHLGHGASVGSEKDWGYFAKGDPSRLLVEDMHQLRELVQKENPGIPYFMLGHSMGSYLLRRYLTVHGEGLRGAIIMGTGFVSPGTAAMGSRISSLMSLLHGDTYRSRFVSGLAFNKGYSKYDMTGQNPENSWLTKDAGTVTRYYHDPRCTYLFTLNGFKGLFDTVTYTCRQENAEKIPKDLPILIVSGKADPVGDFGEGVKKVNEMLKKAGIHDLSMKLFEGDRHEILNELDRETVYAYLLEWIQKRN